MTLFVLSRFADARTCLSGHFWRFWGNLNPKMLSAIVWTPKRGPQGPQDPYVHTILTSQRMFWTIVREISCTGYFSRRVREKINQNKKEALYFTYLPRRSLMVDWHKFWLRVRLVDLINCAKFYRNRLRGLYSVRGRNLTIPIGLRCRR